MKEQFVLLGDFFRAGFRRTALWCAVGMAAAAALGFGMAMIWPDAAWETIDAFAEQVAEAGVVDEAGRMSVFALLMNNWRAMLLSAAYGLIPFLFLPVISLISNGALLGIMAGAYQMSGMPLAALAAGVLPHGMFELPALVLSIACGVRLCRNMCWLASGGRKMVPFMELAEELLRVLVLAVAPLTVAAAFVECYVTPAVMGWFL